MNLNIREFVTVMPIAVMLPFSIVQAQDASTGLGGKLGPAFVKLYGVADIGLASMSGKLTSTPTGKTGTQINQRFSGLLTGGLTASRVGIAAEMPFSDGYKGLMVLELGPTRLDQTVVDSSGNYRSSVTNGLEKTRKSYVGVSGGFGRVIAGRLQSPAYDWSFKYDALSGALDPVYAMALAMGASINSADRVNDAITYTSPKLSGFTLQANYVFANSRGGQNDLLVDDATAANHQQHAYMFSVDYDDGPLSVGVVYRNSGNTNGVCTPSPSSSSVVACSTPGSSLIRDGKKEWALGASHDFKVVKLYGAFQTLRQNSSSYSNRLAFAGVDIPVADAGHVLAVYARGTGKKDVTSNGIVSTVSTSASGFTLAYTHNLAKNLTLYGGLIRDTNGNNLFGSGLQLSNRTAAASYTAPSNATITAAPGSSESGLITGLRYNF